MNKQMVVDLLNQLAKRRPIFHSEGDLKYELAYEIQQKYPGYEIRSEFPVSRVGDQGGFLDLLAFSESSVLAIELKLMRKDIEVEIRGEYFKLSNSGDPGGNVRSFVKDVAKLEKMKPNPSELFPGWEFVDFSKFAILLAYNKYCWNDTRSLTSRDILKQEEYIFNREKIILGNNYPIEWHEYPALLSDKFKFLVIEVPLR